MKKYLPVLTIVVLATVSLANTQFWDKSRRPTLSLADALKLADQAIAKKGAEFYCIGAHVIWSGQCAWDFEYCSTNTLNWWVEVGADKSVYVYNGPIHHK